MHIQFLDHTDPTIAQEIRDLQQASYPIEAELIGFSDLPPLLESPEDIQHSREQFYGAYVEGRLAGMIAIEQMGGLLEICRVAVHPDFFRRGIGRGLMRYINAMEGIDTMKVSTGEKNLPAIRLYESFGFLRISDKEIAPGVKLTTMVLSKLI